MPESPISFLEAPLPFLNIPLYVVVLPLGIIIIVYLIATRKPRQKNYKPINIQKEVKINLQKLYSTFGIFVGKPLYCGVINIGYIRGFMPIVWNDRVSIKDNIKSAQYKEVKDAVLKTDIDNFKKKDGYVNEVVSMKCLKICNGNAISKLVSNLGIGIKYLILRDDLVNVTEDRWTIDPMAQPSLFLNILFFNKTARKFLEDTSFRINRENELQEIANQIPREMFFSNELAKRIAGLREIAEIEKEKFKGQKEGAED